MLSTDKQTDKQTDRQTDKLTNATKNITSFAKEVIKPNISTTTDGTDIEQVTNFPHLGQKITEDGRCEEEIRGESTLPKQLSQRLPKS